MKTALVAGICFLSLVVTVTGALQKKQVDCYNLDDDVQACVDATDPSRFDEDTVCTDGCKPLLAKYFINCEGETEDDFNEVYDEHCGPLDCDNLNDYHNVQACVTATEPFVNATVCTAQCRYFLAKYYTECEGETEDDFNEVYDEHCEPLDCDNLHAVQDCVDATEPFVEATACTAGCRYLLVKYYIECEGKTEDDFNEVYNEYCGPLDCDNLNDYHNVQDCVDATEPFVNVTVCTAGCRYLLAKYYTECEGETEDDFNEVYNEHCGPLDCDNLNDYHNVQACVDATEPFVNATVCTAQCRHLLAKYYTECEGEIEDNFNEVYDEYCGPLDCRSLSDYHNVQDCVDATWPFVKATVCTARCKHLLAKYFTECKGEIEDEFNVVYDEHCSAARPQHCNNPNDDVQACVDATEPLDKDTACTDKCKPLLVKYLTECEGVTEDEFNKVYNEKCSAAGTVVRLFTLVSAILVAAGN